MKVGDNSYLYTDFLCYGIYKINFCSDKKKYNYHKDYLATITKYES